jgi:hypothetical protein
MSNLRYDFADPSELLGQLLRYRESLAYESKIEFLTLEMMKNTDELKALKRLKEPIDLEIAQLRSLHERGFLDRFGYRESSREIRHKQSEIDGKIHKLQTDNDQFARSIYQLEKYLVPAKDYLNTFKSLVVTYSIVTLSNHGEVSKYLLVPDKVRQMYVESEIELLATESSLGAAVRNKRIGKTNNNDRRFRELEILETDIASDEILYLLSDTYRSTQQTHSYRIMDRVLGGGAVQRWRDARVNEYVKCKRCKTLYPMGSMCNCG